MIVNLSGVENQEPREYIRAEGHYTLKCIDVKQLRVSEKGNPVFRFTFKNKDELYFIDDITITENTKWKIKQLAVAFGFEYDNINIMHFVDMYLVAWIVSRKVKNKADQVVDVYECKQYSKSAKLTNKIPPLVARVEPKIIYNQNTTPIHQNDMQDDEAIPF